MKRRILPLLLVISLGINIGLLLHWVRPHVAAGLGAGSRPGWHAGPMRRHLGLGAAQARQLEGWHREVLAQARPLQDELARKRRDLLALLKERNADGTRLDAVIDEIARLQGAIEKIFVRHSLKIRGAFSPAQLRKYEGCLERGLCPGMMAAAACPAPKSAGEGRATCAPRNHERGN